MPRGKVYCKPWTEKDIQDAIDYLRAGHTKNVTKIAAKFSVPHHTLHNHWLHLHAPAWWAHE